MPNTVLSDSSTVPGVKFRPDSTISERQLMIAMADSGRPVSLATLAAWRKDGLLPPFACQGLGRGKGKTYYWREQDVISQARATFDCLQKHGRPETAIWMLWLSGFRVPLPQLRRAWLHRTRLRGRASLNPVSRQVTEFRHADLARDPSRALLAAALVLGDACRPHHDGEDEAVVGVIHAALSRVVQSSSHPHAGDEGRTRRMWHVVETMGAAVDPTSLVAAASDSDLREAQHYLEIAGHFLQRCAQGAPVPAAANEPGPLWPHWLAERLGPTLFLVILVLLRSGSKALLDRIAWLIENAGPALPPAQIIRRPVRA